MKRDDLNGSVLSIISTRRAGNVSDMYGLVGPATWLVRDQKDADDYRDAADAAGLGGSCVAIKVTGGLCETRNAGLDLAHEQGATAVQLSDDLRAVFRAHGAVGSKSRRERITFTEAVAVITDAMSAVRAKMGGCAPTDSLLNYNAGRPLHTRAFIVGDFIVVRPCELRFDTELKLKEDYDYTLQHVQKFGCVARVNSVLPRFIHRTNPGGACDFRTSKTEQDAIAVLRRKWGRKIIADHPRKDDEVVLRFPKVSK